MCFLKPLRIKKIKVDQVVLENGIKAYYDKKIGRLKVEDLVVVYGNLVINKIYEQKK